MGDASEVAEFIQVTCWIGRQLTKGDILGSPGDQGPDHPAVTHGAQLATLSSRPRHQEGREGE